DPRPLEGPHVGPAAPRERARAAARRRRGLRAANDRRGPAAGVRRGRAPLSPLAARDPPLPRADARRRGHLRPRSRPLARGPRHVPLTPQPWPRRTSYRFSMRRITTVLSALVAAAALLAPAAAHARVVLVATGDGAATLTDVATNQIVTRIPVGGRSRAVAAAPDG